MEQSGSAAKTTRGRVLGVGIDFLASPENVGTDMAVVVGTMHPGMVIPLHSHPDPELIYLLDGELKVYLEEAQVSAWKTARANELVVIPGNAKHALRAAGNDACRMLVLTRGELYDFFQELAEPEEANAPNLPPTPEQMQKTFEAAGRYRYWMASPAENAAIGLRLEA